MSDAESPRRDRSRRERSARILGVTVGLVVVVIAMVMIGAPALVVALLLGYAAYRLAGGGRR